LHNPVNLQANKLANADKNITFLAQVIMQTIYYHAECLANTFTTVEHILDLSAYWSDC